METWNWLERPFPAETLALPYGQPLMDIDDGRARTRGIVDTIREPLLGHDKNLRVATANRPVRTRGEVGNGSWILETTEEVGNTLAQALVISVGTGLFAFTVLAALVAWVSL